MVPAKAAAVLSAAAGKYDRGEEDATYLRDAVRAALVLLDAEEPDADDTGDEVEYPSHREQVETPGYIGGDLTSTGGW